MFTIALTGGIASGKSTVAEQFNKLGIAIIDADATARNLVQAGTQTLQKIIQHFGDDILLKSGNLDRKALGKIIFSNPPERRWLEDLLHPLIRAEIITQLNDVTSPYCIMVIPLLVESAPPDMIDRVLVVDVPEHIQLARLRARDNLNTHEAKKILQSQASREQRLEIADDVIHNDRGVNELSVQVQHLHQFYLAIAAKL